MGAGQARQMMEDNFRGIHHLEQQHVDEAGAVGRHAARIAALGERFAAGVNQPLHLGHHLEQAWRGVEIEARRDEAVREFDKASGTHLLDPRQGQQDQPVLRLPFEDEAGVQLAEPQVHRLALGRAAVAHRLGERAQAAQIAPTSTISTASLDRAGTAR